MDKYKQVVNFMFRGKHSRFFLFYKKYFIEIILIIILIASWFMLKGFWVDLINLLIVDPIFSKLHNGLGFFTSIIVLLVILFYLMVYFGERIPSKGRLLLTFFISAIYLVCFFSGEWNYLTPLENWKLLSYANVLFLPFLGEIIHLIVLRCNAKIEKTKSELEFEHALVEGITIDSYNRNPYIEAISTILEKAYDSEGSFAIGISGSWGSGKSSFVNMLKGKLRNSADIIIEFKPWYCKSPNDINEEFFKKYQNEISVYSPKISTLISEYSHALAEIEKSKMTIWLNYTIKRFGCKDKQSQYEDIKEKLLRLNLKVLVIIDDLDRLDTAEVMEVLRLIRNSANFPFTQFIVAYDKDYVIQSIHSNKIHNAPQFLEKIFNLDIDFHVNN